MVRDSACAVACEQRTEPYRQMEGYSYVHRRGRTRPSDSKPRIRSESERWNALGFIPVLCRQKSDFRLQQSGRPNYRRHNQWRPSQNRRTGHAQQPYLLVYGDGHCCEDEWKVHLLRRRLTLICWSMESDETLGASTLIRQTASSALLIPQLTSVEQLNADAVVAMAGFHERRLSSSLRIAPCRPETGKSVSIQLINDCRYLAFVLNHTDDIGDVGEVSCVAHI